MRLKKGSERKKTDLPSSVKKSEKCFSVKYELCSPWFTSCTISKHLQTVTGWTVSELSKKASVRKEVDDDGVEDYHDEEEVDGEEGARLSSGPITFV